MQMIVLKTADEEPGLCKSVVVMRLDMRLDVRLDVRLVRQSPQTLASVGQRLWLIVIGQGIALMIRIRSVIMAMVRHGLQRCYVL